MRVEFDEPKCVAAGQCAMVAPDVFDQRDDDGVAIVLDAEPPEDQYEAVREAAAVWAALTDAALASADAGEFAGLILVATSAARPCSRAGSGMIRQLS